MFLSNLRRSWQKPAKEIEGASEGFRRRSTLGQHRALWVCSAGPRRPGAQLHRAHGPGGRLHGAAPETAARRTRFLPFSRVSSHYCASQHVASACFSKRVSAQTARTKGSLCIRPGSPQGPVGMGSVHFCATTTGNPRLGTL